MSSLLNFYNIRNGQRNTEKFYLSRFLSFPFNIYCIMNKISLFWTILFLQYLHCKCKCPPLICLFISALFVIDVLHDMFIFLFPTPLGHFHFHPTLRFCVSQYLDCHHFLANVPHVGFFWLPLSNQLITRNHMKSSFCGRRFSMNDHHILSQTITMGNGYG